MHAGALASCFLTELGALPADAEGVAHGMALDAHDALAGGAPNGHGVGAEAVANVLGPDEVLHRALTDLGQPPAVGTRDHGPCVAVPLPWCA